MVQRSIKAMVFATVAAGVPAFVCAAPVVGNASFETPKVAGDTYTKTFGSLDGATDLAPWVFGASGNASYDGVVVNSSALNASGIPDGTQAAFLQGTGSISQDISGFDAGAYTLSFEAEARPGGGNPIAATIDTTPILFTTAATVTPGASFVSYTSDPFIVTAGTHTLTLAGTIPYGPLDRTSFVDLVSINSTPEPAALGIAAVAALGVLARRRRN